MVLGFKNAYVLYIRFLSAGNKDHFRYLSVLFPVPRCPKIGFQSGNIPVVGAFGPHVLQSESIEKEIGRYKALYNYV